MEPPTSQVRTIKKSCTTPRRGKWSTEEEAFAARLIADFDAGLLPSLEDGATLRAFLSKKLNCSAMRISKKFAGDKCLGKQIYLRRPADDPAAAAEAQELAALEHAFLASVARAAVLPTKRPREGKAGGGARKRAKIPTQPPMRRIVSASESTGASRCDSDSLSEDEAPARLGPVRFKRLGSATDLARLGGAAPWGPAPAFAPDAREARELAEAHRRSNAHFEGPTGREPIQPPPARLMLELGPPLRAKTLYCGAPPGTLESDLFANSVMFDDDALSLDDVAPDFFNFSDDEAPESS
jgi:hypothetical protein